MCWTVQDGVSLASFRLFKVQFNQYSSFMFGYQEPHAGLEPARLTYKASVLPDELMRRTRKCPRPLDDATLLQGFRGEIRTRVSS